jgi:hypothetical protein
LVLAMSAIECLEGETFGRRIVRPNEWFEGCVAWVHAYRLT